MTNTKTKDNSLRKNIRKKSRKKVKYTRKKTHKNRVGGMIDTVTSLLSTGIGLLDNVQGVASLLSPQNNQQDEPLPKKSKYSSWNPVVLSGKGVNAVGRNMPGWSSFKAGLCDDVESEDPKNSKQVQGIQTSQIVQTLAAAGG